MNPRALAGLLLALTLVGCSAIDPDGIGAGRFLQIVDRSGRVIVEMDTHNGGMLNCPNQANILIQENRNLAPLTKCSDKSFANALPFSFLAHRQLRESDGYRPASPYMTRALTGQVCIELRDATGKMEKTVILEDRCGGAASRKSER